MRSATNARIVIETAKKVVPAIPATIKPVPAPLDDPVWLKSAPHTINPITAPLRRERAIRLRDATAGALG
jgi:hypothetical protein